MNTTLMLGTRIVILALLAYSLAFFRLHKLKRVSPLIMGFQISGLGLDITATILMIAGSTNSPLTFHGLMGYSALVTMMVETVLIIRFRLLGGEAGIPGKLIKFSRLAYFWWVAAFVFGGVIVLIKYSGL